jgi:hypothetical protein
VLGYCCGCICHFLTAHNLCGVSIPSLLALLICLASLRGHVDEDHEDLSIRDLEHVARFVGVDGRTGNLECEAVWGRRMIDVSTMSRYQGSAKLLKHTALASRVFGVLVDRARVIKMTSVVSMM